MGDDIYVKNKDKNQLLADMKGTAPINTAIFEQIRMGIIVRCTEDLEKSMNANAQSSNRLAQQLVWLNILLTIATIAGVVLLAIQMLKY